jgi:hypothetical protein
MPSPRECENPQVRVGRTNAAGPTQAVGVPVARPYSVDGWREDFSAAFLVARTHSLALAKCHLHNGQDVVVPQLVTSFDHGNPFEVAAH